MVTATERFCEAPLRVWCAADGECLAELGSCLPAADPGEGGGLLAAADGEEGWHGGGAASDGVHRAPDQAEQLDEEEQPAGGTQQYQRQWEGVTSLACRGAFLVSGNAGGTVCERDYGRGGPPDGAQEEGSPGGGTPGGSKFWAL